MPAPVLEFDMLIEMKKYMLEMIEEHKREINALVNIRIVLKKAHKIPETEQTNKRIDYLQGLENKAHNFVLFLNDYLKLIK